MFTRLLFDMADQQPQRPFLFFEERTFTYRGFAGLVSAFAATLKERGIGRGSHVALICGNRPAYLVAWFALTEAGAVTVPLNAALVADGLRYTLTQSDATHVLIDETLIEDKMVFLEGLEIEVLPIGSEIETGDSPLRPLAGYSPDPSALNSILFTSGTTGLPKGAMVSQGCYLAAGEDMVRSLSLTPDERILVVLPLFHANPQMYAVMSVLQVGASLVLAPRFSASEFFPYARRYGATGFTFVGTILNILEKAVPTPPTDHSLRWCVGGGAPADIWRAVSERFGIRVLELYGMTETGGWVTMNTVAASRIGTVGRPRQGVRIEIVSEEGEVLAAGEKGEIAVSSEIPNLFFSGYYNNPQATASTLRGNALYTGDSGRIDESGFLVFEGRIKDLIRRGGEMISPTEIELQIMKHPHVLDCGVVGVPDDILGEEIKAVVVAREGFEPIALAEFLRSRLPPYMVPRYIAQAAAIPKTETEKVQRHALRTFGDRLADLSPRAASPAPVRAVAQ